MKVQFTLREMFLIVAIAVLAVGWLMDRYRQEKIIKMQDDLQNRTSEQLAETTYWLNYKRELGQELKKLQELLGEIKAHEPSQSAK